MLEIKSQKLKTTDIAVLKLNSGEEVIGRVTNIANGSITITKPGTLGPVQTAQGITIAMQPFMFGVDADGSFVFTSDKYIVALPAMKQAADMYTKQTSSIQSASSVDLSGIDLSNLKT